MAAARMFVDLRVPFIGLATGLALLAALRQPAAVASPTTSPAPGAGSVAGVVLDLHGDPVPGALVLVVDAEGRAVAEGQTAVGGGEGSPGLGEFRFDGLPAGEYGLRAVVPESESVARLPRVPVRAWEDTRVQIKVDLGY